LLEGLEISEILLSEISFENRFDSEFYQKIFIKTDRYLKSKKGFEIGSKFKVTDGEHGSVVFRESGIKYLGAENIKNGYVDITNIKYVDETVNKKNLRAEVKVGDLLISIKGTLGEIAIAEQWLLPANMSRDVAILKPLNGSNISSYFLSVFLMTRYGGIQSQRGGSGGVVQMITLGRLRKFIVPIFSQKLDKTIEDLYLSSLSKRVQSKQNYTQAENFLLEEIGLQDFEPSKEPVNIKSFAASFGTSGRLDAEYYQKKYEDIENKILNSPNGFTTINNEFEQISLKSKKEKIGFNYIEIGDVNVSDGSCESNYVETKELPANAKTLAKKGDILISKVRPYRGAVTLINFEKEDLIVSGAFTVLREKKKSIFSNEVLKVLLRTKEYKELLLKFNVGTSYPVIKDIDVLNLPIPKISKEIQENITSKIQHSSKLKKQSEHLLEVAKRAVEIAIEENEAVALAFIKKETA